MGAWMEDFSSRLIVMRLSLSTCLGFFTGVRKQEVTRWGLFLRRGVLFYSLLYGLLLESHVP